MSRRPAGGGASTPAADRPFEWLRQPDRVLVSDARPDNFIRSKERERYPNKIRIYQQVETEPGEQAQVDWGHFGKMEIILLIIGTRLLRMED